MRKELIVPQKKQSKTRINVLPDAWSCYSNTLLQRLQSLIVDCHMGALFMGAFLYSDDQLLIAPNRRAIGLMLWQVQKFARDFKINFSTDPDPSKSKSKLIFVGAVLAKDEIAGRFVSFFPEPEDLQSHKVV